MFSAATQGSCSVDFGSKCSLPLPNSTGFVTHSGNLFLRHGMSRESLVSSCSYDGNHKLSGIMLKKSYSCSSRRLSMVCSAGHNSYRRNQEFSRQQGGSSRGKSKQYYEREDSENTEETDFISSKNGSLLSLANNPRYQATAVPGRREKEIVELFLKVQAQLRERSAIKEENKIEAALQGQGERGTVDSLLKLLRKHSVDQKKKSGNEEDLNLDHAERNSFLEDEQNLNLLSPNNVKSDEVQEPSPFPSARPVSNFRKQSPVPRVKFQPVFTAEDDNTSSATTKSQGRRKKNVDKESKATEDIQTLMLEGPEEMLEGSEELAVNEQLYNSDSNEAKEDAAELSPDLGSLKLTELRDIAKSQGIKGYSKLKKAELVELLSG